jgi:nucleoid-associated protein YgaU
MAKITSINKSGAHPYHLIHTNGGGSTVYGWVNTVDMDGVMDIKRDTSNKVVHTVVGGECLSVICANYSKKYGVNISWKSLAEYNKLKNPGSIDVGQKITIVW